MFFKIYTHVHVYTYCTYTYHTHVYISIFFCWYIYICIYTYKYSFIYIYIYITLFFGYYRWTRSQAPRWGNDFYLSWEFLCQWHSNEIIIVLVSRIITRTFHICIHITGFFGSYFFLQFCISSSEMTSASKMSCCKEFLSNLPEILDLVKL